MRTLTFLAAAAALLAACSQPSGPRGDARPAARQQPAYLAYPGAAAEVDVPSTVRIGEPLTVQVVTFGNGCNEAGGNDVRMQGLEADVFPWDLDHSSVTIDCQDLLRTFRHSATLRFDKPGTATVRVNGRRLPGGEPVVIIRTVIIQ